ncbi:MAG: hypothetical protein GYB31_09240 [Bacteroidetes bacterium]|nr:hypothetical protein [Bacteroidota bacterium]
MEPSNSKLQSLIQNGYDFRVGDYVTRGWDFYTKNFLPITGLLLLAGAIPVVFSQLGLGGLSGLVNLLLIGPFVAGALAIFLRRASEGETPGFEAFGEAKDYMGKLIGYNVLITLILIACFIPLILIMASSGGVLNVLVQAIENPEALAMYFASMSGTSLFLMLLGFIPFIYFGIAYWWAPYLIVYKDMAPWQAMEASRKVVSKRWGSHFLVGLLIVGIAILISVAGALLSFGLTITLIIQLLTGAVISAILNCSIFAAYEDVVGFDEGEKESDLIDHLVS